MHRAIILLIWWPCLAADFYVALGGSDTSPGSETAPFATLERARDAIRGLKASQRMPADGVTVWIRGGVYELRQSFRLVSQDSGAPEAPIVYRARPDEEVRIIGGRRITGFAPAQGAAGGREHIVQADLKAQGVTDFGAITARGFPRPIRAAGLELFFQGKPMTLARWPNSGWVRIAAAETGRFTYEGDRPSRWLQADDVWLHGYWSRDWADSYENVASIDPETREIATEPPHGVYGYTKGKRYYALNLLEELDAPGEWYLDRKSGVLYFWPPAPLEEGAAYVSLLETPLISLRGASHVMLRGLTLEYGRGTGIEIVGGARNLVAGCTLRNLGNLAVRIDGGEENGVVSCDIYETGDGGILLGGGDRRTLSAAHNYAVNNHIRDFSRWVRTYRPAVQVAGVGNRVAHNLMHDAPHAAILLKGNEHLIEFNEIHSVALETADVGAFYMGRDFTERGNVIRHNFFHDLPDGDVNAVYLDDCASGTLVFGNVFYRAGRAAFIGGGRDNTVRNNLFVECRPSVHVDARGLTWASFWFDGRDSTVIDRLKAMNYTEPPYSLRYPSLPGLWEDEPAVPKGNWLHRNVSWGGRWLDLHDGLTDRILRIEENLIDRDPGFLDLENKDFRLRPDSPAYKLGFQPIPMEKIGLYVDEYRPARR